MKKTLKKIALSICIISFMQISINAQNEMDALRFSEIDWQGTARFMGAGKAFGAVGAEFSALSTNPASIGLYKKIDITFTPLAISIFKNKSSYNGTTNLGQAVRGNIGNAGIVVPLPGISSTQWKKFPIAFGFNRINNFNNTFTIEGRNHGATIGSVFAAAAEGLHTKDIDFWKTEQWAAWESYLINPYNPMDSNCTSYYPAYLGKDMLHKTTVSQRGGIDEMLFSFGANFNDKLFFGLTMGIPFINYLEDRTFTETNDKKYYDTCAFRSLKMHDKLTVRATGINLKLGVIYQPFDFMRVGVAFHTPTFYGNMRDYLERKISFTGIDHKGVSFEKEESYTNTFNYSLTTPLRAMANVAFFIAKRAFISAEYEFADYRMASMYSEDYNFSNENRAIENKYAFSHIARIGAELSITQAFAVRAGYNYVSSPYKSKINDASKHYVSAGFGFKTAFLYGDLAYTYNTSNENYWMFDPEFVNTVKQKFITHRIIMTLGVKF